MEAKNPSKRGTICEQPACKPGFVMDDHLSSSTIAGRVKRVAASERIALLC